MENSFLGQTVTVKNNGVVWQSDKTFLLMLEKLKVNPAGKNDTGYVWW